MQPLHKEFDEDDMKMFSPVTLWHLDKLMQNILLYYLTEM